VAVFSRTNRSRKRIASTLSNSQTQIVNVMHIKELSVAMALNAINYK